MRTTFRAIILLLSVCFALSANGEIIFNPLGTSPTQRILSYKNYDDIRIDRDLDGRIDEWYLRKGNTEIYVRYQLGTIESLQFKVFNDTRVKVNKYIFENNRMLLVSSEDRPMLVMHGSTEDEACAAQQAVLTDKISILSEDVSAILENASNEKKSCDVANFPKFSRNLKIELRTIAKNPTGFSSCVEKQNIEGVDSSLVSARITATMAKMKENPSAPSNIFSCDFTTESSLSGSTTEDGKIRFGVPKNGDDPPTGFDRMQVLIYHEITHAAGVTEEDAIKQIIKSCVDPNNKIVQNMGKGVTMNMVPTIRSNVEASAQTLAKNESANTNNSKASEVKSTTSSRSPASDKKKGEPGVNMKNEIANAKAVIPSAQKLAATKTDKSPAGKEAAVRESLAESAPLFKTANQVMGASNTPAMADNSEDSNSNMPASYSRSSSSSSGSSSSNSAYSGTSTYSDSEVSGSSGSGGSSSSGKRYQSRHGRYQSKGSSGSGGGVGADEFIAEEVDLTKGAQASRSGSSNRGSTTRYQNETGNYNPTAQTTGSGSRSPASSTDEVSRGRGSAVARGGVADSPAISSGGGSPISLGSSSGGGGGSAPAATTGTRNTTGRTAASSRAPASDSAAPINKAQQREVMSTIVDRDYSQVRTELKSDAFQTELKANGIKVIDYNGNRWGAPEGTVIYLDDGSRFIRQR